MRTKLNLKVEEMLYMINKLEFYQKSGWVDSTGELLSKGYKVSIKQEE
jgi:hypothetical protein